MPFIVYEIRKDLMDNEVRIGQTANIQRRAREHFKEELQEWRGGKREKYGTMPFLSRARLRVLAVVDDRRDALKLERSEQEKAERQGLKLVHDPTPTYTKFTAGELAGQLARQLDGTGRKPRKRARALTLPRGTVLHARGLEELLGSQRSANRVGRRALAEEFLALLQDEGASIDTVSDRLVARVSGAGREDLRAVKEYLRHPQAGQHARYVPGECPPADKWRSAELYKRLPGQVMPVFKAVFNAVRPRWMTKDEKLRKLLEPDEF